MPRECGCILSPPSSLRKQGPIRRGRDCENEMVDGFASTTAAWGYGSLLSQGRRVERPEALPSLVMRTPVAPAGIFQAAKISAERAADLALVGGDDALGFADLGLQLGDGLFHLAGRPGAGDLPEPEPAGFQMLQGLAVLLDLGPVPRNLTVTVCNHTGLPDMTDADHK